MGPPAFHYPYNSKGAHENRYTMWQADSEWKYIYIYIFTYRLGNKIKIWCDFARYIAGKKDFSSIFSLHWWQVRDSLKLENSSSLLHIPFAIRADEDDPQGIVLNPLKNGEWLECFDYADYKCAMSHTLIDMEEKLAYLNVESNKIDLLINDKKNWEHINTEQAHIQVIRRR